MKKTGAFFAGLMSLALLISCGSTKVDSTDIDSYEDSASEECEATAIPLTTNKSKDSKADSDPYSLKKIKGKEKKGFMDQLIGTKKFEKYDQTTVYLKKDKKRNCIFIHKPETELAGFLVRYDTSNYACYLSENERNILRKSVEQYLSDFDEKKLDKKKKKSERAYGQGMAYEEFGIAEAMMTGYSKPKIYFGYKFLGKSPYFCIFVVHSPNLNEDMGDKKMPQSIDQKYYFTRAQIQKLLEFLEEENISHMAHPVPVELTAPDSYEEAE